MASQLGRPKPVLAPPSAVAAPTELIRMLLSQVAGLAEHEDIGPPAEEIILDVDIDGARYLLVRLPSERSASARLSPREREIVRMVAQGHSNKIIADVLSISAWTVCTHLRRIFAKLGVGSRAAMVARLLEVGGLPNAAGAPAVRGYANVTNNR